MATLLELLKQKQQEMAAANKGRTAKIPDGSSRWRVLGSWRGEGQQFWHDFGQHYVKDESDKLLAIYICAEKTHGKPCAVCDAISTGIKGASDDTTMKLLKEAKSGARVLVNALQLDGQEPNKVQILEMPPKVFEQFLAICAEWEEAGETVLGVNGKDIVVQRSGALLNTKYMVHAAAKSTVVPASVVAKVHDLDEYVAQESAEAQSRALNSVRGLTGLLPPAPFAAALPSAARGAAALVEEEDPYAIAKPPARRAAPVEFEDVPDLMEKPAPAAKPAAPAAPAAPAKPAATAAKPAAAPESTGDADLDDLLASLG